MSYDISWHRRKETIYNYKNGHIEESVYYDDNDERVEEIKQLHSSFCGRLDFTKKPFEEESTGLNITSNLYKMLSWAVNGDPTLDWKESLHCKTGAEAEPILRAAIKRMEENRTIAKQYNAPNGWGTYPNALRFLKDLLAESIYFREAYMSINY